MMQEALVTPPCEAIILTALSVELKAVLSLLGKTREIVHPSGTIYQWGSISRKDRVWHIAVAQIGGGGTQAAIEVEKALSFLHPRLALFVGIAGGLKDVLPGDVVVATKIYAYESGKAGQTFEPRPELWRTSHALEQRARHEATKDTWYALLDNVPSPAPGVHIGPLAAGAQVITSTQSPTGALLRATYGDALAVEMEGHGFLQALQVNQSTYGLVIRGIADRIDDKAETESAGRSAVAARHAAAFAFQILATFTLPTFSTPTPIWNVPFARNPFFTGREELLKQLHTQLQTMQTAALSQPQAISGLGGIGKTQLAIEYAHRYGLEYQAILWVRADTTETLNASYAELARVLQLPQQSVQEQEMIVRAVKDWLGNKSNWLLILDNADELNTVQAFLPTRFAGHILLTTRAQTMGKFARRLDVRTLDQEAGALLLLRRANLIAPGASLDAASVSDCSLALTLTEELGGLPLALDQAGAYIEESQCDLAEYLRQYHSRRAELLAKRGELIDEHPESVATTWAISFAKVEQANPMAAEILRICAFLVPDAIPEELLMETLKRPLPLSEETAPERNEGTRPLTLNTGQFDESMALLRGYSLVQRNPQERQLSVHRLVQAVLYDTLQDKDRYLWRTRVMLAINAIFPYVGYSTWSQSELLLPHASLHLHDTFSEVQTQQELAALLGKVARYLFVRTKYDEAESLYQRSLDIQERTLGSEHLQIASTLTRLASLYQHQDHFALAEHYFQRALHIQRQTQDPLLEAVIEIELATLYHEQGKYPAAEASYQHVLQVREQALEPDHSSIAAVLTNLAVLYQQQAKYLQAEQCYQRVLTIYKKIGDPNAHALAVSSNNLAGLYYQQGKYEQAETFFQEALHIHIHNKRPEATLTLGNLAELSYEQARYEQAELLYKRAKQIEEQMMLVPNRLNNAHILLGLATLYKQQGRYKEAEPLYLQALNIREELLLPDHPEVAWVLNGLADLCREQGKYKEARSHYLRVLSIRKQTWGKQHPETAETMYGLAQLREAQGDQKKAWKWYTYALAIHEQTSGRHHPKTVQIRSSLIALLHATGEHKQATQLETVQSEQEMSE